MHPIEGFSEDLQAVILLQTIIRFIAVFIFLILSFSSLEEVWVAVLNITGPLSSWSLADNKLPGELILFY